LIAHHLPDEMSRHVGVNPKSKGITVLSINKTIRSLSLAALVGVAAVLSGCGGGGAIPTPPPAAAPPPAFIAFPTTLNVYSGTPAVVTITSGVLPFQAFTADGVVLPVSQSISGAAITLVANAVETERPVAVTLRDGLGRTVNVTAVVKPSPLLSSMSVIPAEGTLCSKQTPSGTQRDDNASFCSGETATARITVRSSGSTPIANRQIRYDVVQGAYNFVLDQSGTVLAKTATIVTDQNGQAIVTLKSDAPVPTQVALIRATDLVSGNRVDGSFTIVQSVGGSPTFNISPKEATFTGFYDNQCGSGSLRFVLYGGTPPYNVVANNASIAYPTLSEQLAIATSVVVAKSGDFFYGVANGGSCSGKREGLFTITDSAGQVITAKLTTDKGSVPFPVAPPATTLVVTPVQLTLTGLGTCANADLQFVVTGGTPSYRASSSNPNKAQVVTVPATPNPQPTSFTFTSPLTVRTNNLVPGDSVIFAITDSGTQIKTATVNCVAPI
jgi:hypothetical protein